MDLNQLRMLVAVAELGNLTQAAEHLHLSQPAASAQIKSLEEEFGVTLFERRPTGLTLTRSGMSLLPMVQNLLAKVSDVLATAKGLSGRVYGPIKLASVAAALDKSFLPLGEMLHFIRNSHPDLNIEVYQRSSRDVWIGVEDGTFDAGLAFGRRDARNLRSIVLQEVSYRIVAPIAWDASVCEAPWKELASLPWVTCAMGGRHHDMAMQLFKKFDRQPDKIIHGDSEQVIIGLVTGGMGLGLMREELAMDAQANGKIRVIDKGRPSTRLQIIYSKSRANDPTIRAILDVLGVSQECSAESKRLSSAAPIAARRTALVKARQRD
jgi:DNA-binding transcriptional LysR family regulator